MTLENITTSGNIFQYHMVFEKAIFIFHVTFFNVTWKMKLLLQYYTFVRKYLIIFSSVQYLWSFTFYLWMNDCMSHMLIVLCSRTNCSCKICVANFGIWHPKSIDDSDGHIEWVPPPLIPSLYSSSIIMSTRCSPVFL